MKTSRHRSVLATTVLLAVTVVVTGLLPNVPAALAAGPCGPPVTSVIACENTLAGDTPSDWQVNGSGDSALRGFATSMSVNAGQAISFKVAATASAYHFDILRLGYYQGNGARKVAAGLTPSASYPQTQPACKSDSTSGLIDCGNWAVSASWTVPSTAVSGVYLAHLIRNDNGAGSTIPFVVRNDAGHSDIVVQTSDETWEAYNTYGGNSLYTCTVACPPGSPAAYKAAYKVSYNRPFNGPTDDQGRSWLTYAELPMIQFLEQSGYDVSYVSGVDVDAGTANLTNHKLYISSGHDEYWTGTQRANVTAARDAGVNLAFFSGNELFWKTRLEASTDGSNTPRRTLVTYKDTHFGTPQDPQYPSSWTGTWEDPRFSPPADGGNPSNALTGQKFIANSGTTDIKVPAAYAQLRMWRGTPVAALTGTQSVTLGPGLGTLGYEWDEDTDNGFRPPGLFDLSSTTNTNTEIFTDYGSSTQLGKTAKHNLTLYRATSGALVFGAGTVQWAWGLNNSVTGGAVDKTMQQATVNLFADMGAQPATILSGLVAATKSTDTTAPTSTVTSPLPAANLTDGQAVTISGTAFDTGGGVVGGVEVSTDGGTTWHPASGTGNWTYTWAAHGAPSVTIKTRATDDSGNTESPKSGPTVNIACPCSIFGTSLVPSKVDGGDPNAVEIGAKFTSDSFGTISGIRFYKSTANTGTHVGNLWTSGGQRLATATFSGETASGWQQVTFSTPVPISPQTTYVASYYAPKGHYANDDNYLYRLPQSPNLGLPVVDSPPLHLSRQTPGNPNGVYVYGSSSIFPANADLATNYWVDVMFTPQPAPGTTTNVVATAGYASAGLTWTAPSTGGAVTTYTITPYVGSTPQTQTTVTGNPAPTTATAAGLTNGTTYTFTVRASNPNGSGNASTQSNAVTPSASAPVVQNGDFESGLSPWVTGGVKAPTASTALPHGGTRSALLGMVQPNTPQPNGDSTLSQSVFVPTGTSQLSFWSWTGSADTLCSGAACVFDWQEAQLQDTQGHLLSQIFKSATNTQAWAQTTVNTSAYAGQTIVVYFNVHEDGSSPADDTWMYLDDVSLVTTGAPTAPSAPTGVTATAGSGSATVSWTAPGNGGSPITSYTVTPYIGSTPQSTVQVAGSPPATSTVVTGLASGQTYTFKVSATNTAGTGPQSAASAAVTIAAATVPGKPTNVVATAGNASANVSWSAPANGGSPITTYTVTGYPQGESADPPVSTTVSGSPPVTSVTVTGLTNGDSYAFSVVAANAVGPGQASALSPAVTPGTLPSAPSGVSATAGPVSATVSWTAPANGGSPISSYTVTPYVGPAAQVPTTVSGSPPATTVTIALNAGVTYTFTVTATNGIGTGPASAQSNAVTPTAQTAPGAPSGVTAAPANASSLVSWTAPTDGGSSITSYTVTPFIGSTPQAVQTVSGSPPPTTLSVVGTNGTTYTFTVRATNVIGSGPDSAASGPVTPGPAPSAPTGVSASAANASALVSWTVPASGANPITGYTLTPYLGGSPLATTTVPAPASSATVGGLTNGSTYTFTVSATNAVGAGPASAASNAVTPSAGPPPCPCTIFGATVPGTPDSGDNQAVVVGVTFNSDLSGFITGVRFYKSAANTGTHVGALWSSTGTLLASATFSGETASGWQQVSFAAPVAVTAGTTYVASYLAPAGRYAATTNGLANAVDSPPLHALANTVTPNGVYKYSATSAFPTSSYQASNYWVDPVFTVSSAPGAPTNVTATAGDTLAGVSWTAPAAGSNPITSYTVTPYVGTTAQTATVVSGSPPATSVTMTGLTNGTAYTFKVTATNSVGTGPASASSGSVTPGTAPPPCPCTILGTTAPATADAGDTSSVVLGVAFNADTNGYVTGVRFYKSAANTGTHVGALWTSTGTLLASATFTGETASGWQQVTFSSPVAVTAGTTYVASYLAPVGHYAQTANVYTTAVDNPPLHGLATASAPNGNGIYVYSGANAFPTNSFQAANYWVDVTYSQTVQAGLPAAPTGVTAVAGTGSATVSWAAPANGGSAITSYVVTPYAGAVAQATTTVSGSPPATSVTVANLTAGTSYTFTVAAVNAVGTGPSSAPSNAVTPTSSTACPCTIFGNTAPAVVDAGDGKAVVLGVAFTADRSGQVTGVRFYKAAANTGTHIGTLWSSSGTSLASATFTGETASGWQKVTFSTPVLITAGTRYVVSYLAPVGHYSATSPGFSTAVDSPPLHAVSNSTTPNGLYIYSSTNKFPTSSYNASNYWVDLTFS